MTDPRTSGAIGRWKQRADLYAFFSALSFAKTPSGDWTMGKRRASHEANGCRLPKLDPETGRWASGVRTMRPNAPDTRSVGRPARSAQNPHRPHAREPGAAATACPAPPPFEATAIRTPGSPPLRVALRPLVWLAAAAPP